MHIMAYIKKRNEEQLYMSRFILSGVPLGSAAKDNC